MKKNKTVFVLNYISWLVLVLAVLAQGWLLWNIWTLKMLPNAYFLAICGVFALVTAGLCLLLFRKKKGKWQKKSGHGKQIAGCLLSVVVILGCLACSSVVGRVLNTISAITAPQKVNMILEIYVRHDDAAQGLQDIAAYDFAISEDVPEEDASKLIAELEKVMGTTVNTVKYPSAAATLEALLNGQTNAAILNSSYLEILDDMEEYQNLGERIRILHEIVIEKEVPQEEKPVTDDKKENQNVTEEPFLIYISGNDARRPELADGGSDVNILLLVNPKTHQVLLINTPRDYYVVNPASGNGSQDKLSHCGLRGINNCIGAMTDLYGQEIDYYARINFSGFRTLIDAIGGVTIHSDIAFSAGDYYIRAGENHLNGAQALAFARERKNLAGGDNDRGKNQMKLISAMIHQLSAGNLISNYAQILESLEGMFSTNFPAEDIGKLVQLQLTQMPQWEVMSFAVTGDNGTDMCWAKGYYAYVMYPHEHMVAHASQLMERFLQGEVLTEADLIVEK